MIAKAAWVFWQVIAGALMLITDVLLLVTKLLIMGVEFCDERADDILAEDNIK